MRVFSFRLLAAGPACHEATSLLYMDSSVLPTRPSEVVSSENLSCLTDECVEVQSVTYGE